MALKYKVGDRVRIKSLDWYNENKNKYGSIYFSCAQFTPKMSICCGDILTICDIEEKFSYYYMEECAYVFTDEMIEGLVEEETKPKFKVGDRVIARDMSGIWEITNVEDDILYTIKRENHTFTLTTYGSCLTLYEKCKSDIELNGFQLPEGYIFKDENGNIINATKIVLEKKKKEYPKTYEECCKVLGVNSDNFLSIRNLYRDDGDEELTDYERDLLGKFDSLRELRICRDAYWKIAGDEMGLGKPWKPDWIDNEWKWCVCYSNNNIEFDSYKSVHHTFSFPTKEMRDAFYENFKELIEKCKELL